MSIFRQVKSFLTPWLILAALASPISAQSLSPDESPLSEPLQVRVNELKLQGNSSIPSSEFRDILEAYQGRLMSFEDIRRVAEAVVTRYRERDFLTVSAYLPEQDLSQGDITIKVVEAKIGDITVEGARHYDPKFVRWMFEPALRGQNSGALVKRSDVQRQLLLLNDHMDVSARSVLRESNQEGVVDLILQVRDERPLHFGFDYNNLGAEPTGRHRLGASLEWGDLTNNGDQLNIRYVESGLLNANTNGIDLFNLAYSIPINNKGTFLDLGYANTAFQVGQEFQVLDIRGDADVYRAGLRHKLIRSTKGNLDLTAGLVFQDIENRVLGSRFSRDTLREFQLGLSGDWASGAGRNRGAVMWTQDLGETLGGMASNDPLSSRRAGGGFSKFKFDLSRVQKLSDASYLILRGSHQAAFDSLPFAEQYGLGGINSVRGYQQSVYLGDTGYNLSAELRFAPIESQRQLFEVGAFIDHGGAAIKSPLLGEVPNATLTGAGLTFQFRLPKQTFIRADLGWPIGKDDALGDIEDGPVPYLIFSKRF